MMRADRGGSSRPLVAIPMKYTGYTIPNLRDWACDLKSTNVIQDQSEEKRITRETLIHDDRLNERTKHLKNRGPPRVPRFY